VKNLNNKDIKGVETIPEFSIIMILMQIFYRIQDGAKR